MDFVLGILVGVTATFIVVLFIGYRLNKTLKERGVPKHRDPPEPPPKFDNLDQRTEDYRRWIMSYYSGLHSDYYVRHYPRLTDEDIKYINHSDGLSLSIRLKAAIEREDFEEAARIRDLMNQK